MCSAAALPAECRCSSDLNVQLDIAKLQRSVPETNVQLLFVQLGLEQIAEDTLKDEPAMITHRGHASGARVAEPGAGRTPAYPFDVRSHSSGLPRQRSPVVTLSYTSQVQSQSSTYGDRGCPSHRAPRPSQHLVHWWRRGGKLDGVLRNFDLGKVHLCLFVRGHCHGHCPQMGILIDPVVTAHWSWPTL